MTFISDSFPFFPQQTHHGFFFEKKNHPSPKPSAGE